MTKVISAPHWDYGKIKALIEGRIEERYDLEYKSAGALDSRNPKVKLEIAKDASAMANSAGGTIIYGIAEGENSTGAPYADRIDPIDRSVFSSDTLDQIIQSVQPKIEDLRITPIDIPESPGRAVYVVTIPQSDTAHQATDKKYHMRHNTTTAAMDDYQIRDVMNRSKHPKIDVSFDFKPFPEHMGLTISVGNEGKVSARTVRVFIRMPMCLGVKFPDREGLPHSDIKTFTTEYCWKNLHYDFVGKSAASDATRSGWGDTKPTEDCFVTRDTPILPRTDLTSAYGLSLTPDSIDQLKGKEISWEAYADNAPVQQGTLDLSDIYTQLEEYYANQ